MDGWIVELWEGREGRRADLVLEPEVFRVQFYRHRCWEFPVLFEDSSALLVEVVDRRCGHSGQRSRGRMEAVERKEGNRELETQESEWRESWQFALDFHHQNLTKMARTPLTSRPLDLLYFAFFVVSLKLQKRAEIATRRRTKCRADFWLPSFLSFSRSI